SVLRLMGVGLVLSSTVAGAVITNFVNFETAPVHPIALGPDGRTLAVCNLPDARVELFDVSHGIPAPIGSVPVGLDPVAVRFASSNELWVVNYISSSISIVNVASRRVEATLETPAGASDLVFAGNPLRAWVSCMRTNAVFVIDPVTRLAVTNIAIDGERPRAMATSPDGSQVYVAIFESGNGTTVFGHRLTDLNRAPAPGPVEDPQGPHGGADPPPNSGTNFSPVMNTNVTRTPPKVSHIVRKNGAGRWMDDNNGDWTEWISGTNAAATGRIPGWDLPDRDVAIIDTATLGVSYANGLMNICMAMGVNPASGEITVVGTDAINERRFEPVLNGVFLRVNVALVDPVTRTNRIRDLNPHLDYLTRRLAEAERAQTISDPRGIEWSSDGTRAYITGMGSRNLLIVNADGARVNAQAIDLEEGPTGIALDEARSRLYVWNRFSSTISVVDTAASRVVTNVPVFDPTPDIVRKGRRHLFDTRHSSGLGLVSCASCHVDGRFDRLAWDLGDPAGNLTTNGGFVFHPMKGPMVTQTLQDIISVTNAQLRQGPLHWRGDRKNIEAFNSTFTSLLSRETELTTNEMAEFKEMLASVFFPPNFLRTFSNSLPVSVPLPGLFGRVPTNGGPALPLPAGNPRSGQISFQGICRRCHEFNQGLSGGTNEFVIVARNGTEGPFKAAQLRNIMEKLGMDGTSTNSRAGFGFMHDGRVDTLTRFLVDGFPTPTDRNIADTIAFLLCFSGSDLAQGPAGGQPSQDVPAATGRQVTFGSNTPPAVLNDMFNLALQTNSRVELVVRGTRDGRERSWLLRRATRDFQSDRHGEVLSNLTEIISSAGTSNEFTAMLVPQGSGVRLGLDRDGDGYFDTSEVDTGFDPADAASHPGRIVGIAKVESGVTLAWQAAPGAKYAVVWRTNLPVATAPTNVWNVLNVVTANAPVTVYTNAPIGETTKFYRVRLEP
ncbi:MAG TPA: hypothetical protein VK850_04255, partial [Candidatus Binatia bacterium]|nr:hypothetical protein [Candidatus Binatia bacterium]